MIQAKDVPGTSSSFSVGDGFQRSENFLTTLNEKKVLEAASTAESRFPNTSNDAEPSTDRPFTLQQLRNAIPPSCFDSSLPRSLAYLLRDIIYAAILVTLALKIDLLPANKPLRILAWTAYMFAQGCVGTGLWILAHECGHGAFSKHQRVNDFIGWIVHSALLVPYFSWKITHARHHRYTGHITKDAVFVPQTEEQRMEQQEHDHAHDHGHGQGRLAKLMELGEETSIVTIIKLLSHQLLGFQMYLALNLTSGRESLPNGKDAEDKGGRPWGTNTSHLGASSRLFLPSQKKLILLSDLGLLLTIAALTVVGQYTGYQKVLLLYVGPYLWTHHWLVAITYLHHTHPDVPHYTPETWTFLSGALGTVDRSIGFIGQHFFHEIIDFHVVHHLFPRIPFYEAERATRAIQPILGGEYAEVKERSFHGDLWDTFRSCKIVAERKGGEGEKGGMKGALYWVVS